MKPLLFGLILAAVASSVASADELVCDHYFNKYGRWVEGNCVKHPELNFAPPPPKEGDVTRVERSADGRVFVHRQGRDAEEWHEVTKGEWVRVR